MSTDKNRVYIFDTTMRDGEQSPGASMSLEEKILKPDFQLLHQVILRLLLRLVKF